MHIGLILALQKAPCKKKSNNVHGIQFSYVSRLGQTKFPSKQTSILLQRKHLPDYVSKANHLGTKGCKLLRFANLVRKEGLHIISVQKLSS